MKTLSPFDVSFWIPVGVAVLCGTIVGMERQLRGKPLDIRTAILICLGTHVFIRLGVEVGGANVDASRVLGQVVTGVGFLGAGVILTRGSHVLGLTTASVIWVLAGIGAAIGFGEYKGAVALSLVAFLVLNVMEWVEGRVTRARQAASERANEPDARRL